MKCSVLYNETEKAFWNGEQNIWTTAEGATRYINPSIVYGSACRLVPEDEAYEIQRHLSCESKYVYRRDEDGLYWHSRSASWGEIATASRFRLADLPDFETKGRYVNISNPVEVRHANQEKQEWVHYSSNPYEYGYWDASRAMFGSLSRATRYKKRGSPMGKHRHWMLLSEAKVEESFGEVTCAAGRVACNPLQVALRRM